MPPVAVVDAKTRWRQLSTQPPAIGRDAELADTLEQLADTDPSAAAERLGALGETDRRRVVAAVLIDAARQPDRAVRLAGDFCRADPTVAAEHGYSLVAVLIRAGEFEAALRFVQFQDATAGETENPTKWLGMIFAGWAERQPQLAAWSASALASDGMRDEALQAVATTWVKTDPSGAANFAAQLPSGEGRVRALTTTLHAWEESDSSAARRFTQTSPALRASDRAALLASFAAPAKN